jgi:hypothetical protein
LTKLNHPDSWNWSLWKENLSQYSEVCLCSGQAGSAAQAVSEAKNWANSHGWISEMANSLSAMPAY